MFPGFFVVRVWTWDLTFFQTDAPNRELMIQRSKDIKDALWWRLQPSSGGSV